MSILATLAAAKLLGQLPVDVAIGRLDYVGRFIPLGMVSKVAVVNGDAVVLRDVVVTYTHDSPRYVSHTAVRIVGDTDWHTMEVGPVHMAQTYMVSFNVDLSFEDMFQHALRKSQGPDQSTTTD